jgi:UDP-perosamine 4-acetyltransferase
MTILNKQSIYDDKSVVILGTGAHAKVVIEIIECMGGYDIIGVCSSDPNAPASLCGYEYLGDFNILDDLYQKGLRLAAMGVGGWTDNIFRVQVFNDAKRKGFDLLTAIHPKSMVAQNTIIGEGCIVDAGANLMTEAVIGRNCIVSVSSLISHESTLADHVLVSGAAKIGAQVTIETGAVIAFGSTVVSRLKIGENAVVAAGAAVLHDVKDNTTVFGIPAKTK